jgi:hypothetical protein
MLKLSHKLGPGEIALGSMLLATRFEQLEALIVAHVAVAQQAEPPRQVDERRLSSPA